MNKCVLFSLTAALIVSCVRPSEQQPLLSTGVIGVHATYLDTKTLFSDGLRFSDNEEILLICESYNRMILSNASSIDKSMFSGEYRPNGKQGIGCKWYSVYPSSLSVKNNGVVTGTLPYIQKAPLDPDANCMYSQIIEDKYDELNQPSLDLNMLQMAGLICITFTNSDPVFENEQLESVKLKASVDLAGDFELNIHSPEFTLTNNQSNTVFSEYQSFELLGKNVEHKVFLFVNPVTITNATLIVRTNLHTFKYTSSSSFTPAAGSITYFQPLDVADFPDCTGPTPLQRRVVCWGDSFTHGKYVYPDILQRLLGKDWIVYDGGQSGDRTYEIAVRQGGLPMVTGAEFEIPAGTQAINIDPLLRTQDVAGNNGYFSIRGVANVLTNPCELEAANGTKVLVNIKSNSTSATLSRVEPGEPLTINGHTRVFTYGARELRNADLTVIYMGANGMYTDESYKLPKNEASIDNLVRQHRQMVDYLEDPSAFMILGFHYKNYENYSYTQKFIDEFNSDGKDHFINLRTEVVKDEETCKKWLLYSGLYANESEIPSSALTEAAAGNWPAGLYLDECHPNGYGSIIFAKLIYDRMADFGLLDY